MTWPIDIGDLGARLDLKNDHIQQFMMAELERRCCQEHHPLESTIQGACNRAGVLLGIVGHKEGCQPRGWIFQVMGFIENQKWRAKPGLGKG